MEVRAADAPGLLYRVTKALADAGADVLAARVATLGIGVQQVVEIVRALGDDARVLVLDEPTAALTGDEAARLFATLARLMQSVEDTTALHRCGRSGLARLREDGARLEHLVAEGAQPEAIMLSDQLYVISHPLSSAATRVELVTP